MELPNRNKLDLAQQAEPDTLVPCQGSTCGIYSPPAVLEKTSLHGPRSGWMLTEPATAVSGYNVGVNLPTRPGPAEPARSS